MLLGMDLPKGLLSVFSNDLAVTHISLIPITSHFEVSDRCVPSSEASSSVSFKLG